MSFKSSKFRLRIGDLVKGRKGRNQIIGKVLESTNRPGKPAVFSRYGFVGVWIQTDEGYKTVINEVELI